MHRNSFASARLRRLALPVLLLLLAGVGAWAQTAQTIAFTALGHRTVGDADIAAVASASSGLPLAFTSSNPQVATVDASTGLIHVVRAGVTVITASQAGDATHAPASARQALWVWNPAYPVITWGDAGKGQAAIPLDLTNHAVSIAAGMYHTVVLKSDGTVVAWGANDLGQTDVPPDLTDVVAVAAGATHSLALKRDGTVVGWGGNAYGQVTIPPDLGRVIAIATGQGHTLALQDDGTVAAWGMNTSGQTTIPPGLNGVVAIAAGAYHTVVLKSDGTVLAWGGNTYGQATLPPDLGKATSISAGYFHTVALRADGTVHAWGSDAAGQSTIPPGLTAVASISAGGYHTVALKTDGTVTAWGENGFGQTRVPVEENGGIKSISAGGAHTVALSQPAPSITSISPASGPATGGTRVVIAGAHFYAVSAVLFGGIPAEDVTVDPSGKSISATAPAGLAGAVDVTVTTSTGSSAVGSQARFTYLRFQNITFPAFGTRTAGFAAFEAGASASSKLAVTYTSSNPWVATVDARTGRIQPLKAGVTVITASQAGDAAYLPAAPVRQALWVWNLPGNVVGWGENGDGQSSPPTDLTGVVSVSGGDDHTAALKRDGTVVVWGGNGSGQKAIPPGLGGVVSIATGANFMVALKSDGTVVAWGDNSLGQTSVPTGLTDVVAISAGRDHVVALKKDGTVVVWGNEEQGQKDIPASLRGVVAVAAGSYHTVALKGDGTVAAWGRNLEGQSAVPVGLNGVVAIAAGLFHTVVLKNDGMVVAWGGNDDGQKTVPTDLKDVVAVAAGAYHTVALKRDGKMVAWGRTNAGQATVPPSVASVVAIAAGEMHTVGVRIPAPVASYLSPTIGPWTGGGTVTIEGRGFIPGTTVNFWDQFTDQMARDVVVDSSGTKITAEIPRGDTFSIDRAGVYVILRTPLGHVENVGWFFYTKAPQAFDFWFEGNPPTYRDSAYLFTVNSAIGLAQTFTSLTPDVCTTTRQWNVKFLKAGICTISGQSAGSALYFPSSAVVESVTVVPRPLSILADSLSKMPREQDPALTYRVTGLLGDDQLTGSLARAEGEDAGSYPISQGTLTAGPNYAIRFTGAALTIHPDPVALSPRSLRNGPRALSAVLAQDFTKAATGADHGTLGTDGQGCNAGSCQSIDLALPGPSSVKVAIYDRLGTPVISWSESFDRRALRRLGGDGRVRLWWNLRSSSGAAVAPGIYLWKVEATSENGQELEQVLRTGVR